MRRFWYFVRKYDLVHWFVGAVGILTMLSAVAIPGMLLALVIGGGAIVAISAVFYLRSRRKHPFRCEICKKKAILSGPRGERAKLTEYVVLVAKYGRKGGDRAFHYSERSMDGSLQNETVLYRNLGPGGTGDKERGERPPHFLSVNNGLLVARKPGSTAETVFIDPPAPIRAGDRIEIERTYVAREAFSRDHESFAKTVLYPTEKLTFDMVFEACPIEYPAGTVHAGIDVEESETKQPVSDGASVRLHWDKEFANPYRRYALSWGWLRTDETTPKEREP